MYRSVIVIVQSSRPQFHKLIANAGARRAFFLRYLRAGRADKTVTSTVSAGDFVRLLLSTLIGMRVVARERRERVLLKG